MKCKCSKSLIKNIFCSNEKSSLDYIVEWAKEIDETVKNTATNLEDYEEHTDERLTFLEAQAWGSPTDVAALLDEKLSPINSELENKVDKVTVAYTIGDFVQMGPNGTMVSSSYTGSSFAPMSHTHSGLSDNTGNEITIEKIGNDGLVHIELTKDDDEYTKSITSEDIETTFTHDTVPTLDSDNVITSGGVYDTITQMREDIDEELAGKMSTDYIPDKIASYSSDESCHVLANTGGEIEFWIEDNSGEDPVERSVSLDINNMANFDRAVSNPDTTPIQNSNKLITSGGVYEAIRATGFNTVNCSTYSYGNPTLTVSNVLPVGEYSDFIHFVSDYSNCTVSIFLHGVGIECTATMTVGEGTLDQVTGYIYYTCSIMFGNLTYTYNVSEEPGIERYNFVLSA